MPDTTDTTIVVPATPVTFDVDRLQDYRRRATAMLVRLRMEAVETLAPLARDAHALNAEMDMLRVAMLVEARDLIDGDADERDGLSSFLNGALRIMELHTILQEISDLFDPDEAMRRSGHLEAAYEAMKAVRWGEEVSPMGDTDQATGDDVPHLDDGQD